MSEGVMPPEKSLPCPPSVMSSSARTQFMVPPFSKGEGMQQEVSRAPGVYAIEVFPRESELGGKSESIYLQMHSQQN